MQLCIRRGSECATLGKAKRARCPPQSVGGKAANFSSCASLSCSSQLQGVALRCMNASCSATPRWYCFTYSQMPACSVLQRLLMLWPGFVLHGALPPGQLLSVSGAGRGSQDRSQGSSANRPSYVPACGAQQKLLLRWPGPALTGAPPPEQLLVPQRQVAAHNAVSGHICQSTSCACLHAVLSRGCSGCGLALRSPKLLLQGSSSSLGSI